MGYACFDSWDPPRLVTPRREAPLLIIRRMTIALAWGAGLPAVPEPVPDSAPDPEEGRDPRDGRRVDREEPPR